MLENGVDGVFGEAVGGIEDPDFAVGSRTCADDEMFVVGEPGYTDEKGIFGRSFLHLLLEGIFGESFEGFGLNCECAEEGGSGGRDSDRRSWRRSSDPKSTVSGETIAEIGFIVLLAG